MGDRADPNGHRRVILASASPRRAELLGRLGIVPDIRPTDVDETIRAGEEPDVYVARLARSKAGAVGQVPGQLIVAADTTVVVDDRILGKPEDDADAAAMLSSLSGRWHLVLTGLHLRLDHAEACAVSETAVRFRPITDAEIAAYIATGEPADKAGAYAIQGAAGAFVTEIRGSDTGVIGLPLATFAELAGRLGITVLPAPGSTGPWGPDPAADGARS